MAKGGYRKPNNPAPVSGPGQLSRRTDGGPGSKQAMREMTGGKYGENKALMEQQQGAPLAGSPTPNPRVSAPAQQAPVTPLFSPTSRPEEPVTAGMPFGPGATSVPGVENINANPEFASLSTSLLPLLKYDTTGQVKMLYDIAVTRGW
jgi:hypothetical protein